MMSARKQRCRDARQCKTKAFFIYMEAEKKPKRPRIGASNGSSDYGSSEPRYEKVNYPTENQTPRREIQASTPTDDNSSEFRPYPGHHSSGYQPRPRFNNYQQADRSNADKEGDTKEDDANVTPYRPSGSYHRQGGYNNQNRQGGYNNYNQNRQGGYRPYNNQNRQGGYNNGYNNQNRQGGYNNGYNNQNRQGGYNNGYNNQNRQGGYNNGYNNQNRQGGYSNGYNNQNRQGGYNNGYNNQNRQGGYNNGYQQGGYQNRQGGYQNRQGGRFGQQNRQGMKFTPRPRQIEYTIEDIDPNEEIRLNKYMANAGLCSRREADEFITGGKVKVNGEVVTELGTKIKRSDVVECDDKVVTPERKCYILLNKPKDCVTTSDDPKGRTTVLDIVKNACQERIYPVGRLDRNTTGVLLLTNDGDLASKLTHPKFVKKKIYHVWTDKDITEEDMQRIADGIELEDGEIHADAISYASETDRNQAGIEIHSGRNRIVRRIFESLGYKVVKLDRVYFAGLTKKNLPRGRWRYLTQEEVNYLRMGAFE